MTRTVVGNGAGRDLGGPCLVRPYGFSERNGGESKGKWSRAAGTGGGDECEAKEQQWHGLG
jgi:hypothetical protein